MASLFFSKFKCPVGVARIFPAFTMGVVFDAVAAKWIEDSGHQIITVSTVLVMVYCSLVSLINHLFRQWRDLYIAHTLCGWFNLGALLLCMILVLITPARNRVVNLAVLSTFATFPMYHHKLCFIPRVRACNLMVLMAAAIVLPPTITGISRTYQNALLMACMTGGELTGYCIAIRVRRRYLGTRSTRCSDGGELGSMEPLLKSDGHHPDGYHEEALRSRPNSPSKQGKLPLDEACLQLIDHVTQVVVSAREVKREVSARSRDTTSPARTQQASVVCALCNVSPATRTLLPCTCTSVCQECSAQLFRYDEPYLHLEQVMPKCPLCSMLLMASMEVGVASRTLVLSIKLPGGARIVIE